MRDIIQTKLPDSLLADVHTSADHWAMDDSTRQRFKELIRDLDPETREIVCDLVRRFVSLEQIIEVIKKRRH
jgi:hypothetical protein